MKTKPFPWKCGTCRERAVQPAVLPAYATELEHDGRKYPISLTDFAVLQCAHCKTVMLDDDANRKLSDALRSAAGLLAPAEIRRFREWLGLTQRDLAAYLRIAESTLSRWETGAQIQQRGMDTLLRTFFWVPEARAFLGATGAGYYGRIGAQKCATGTIDYSWGPARSAHFDIQPTATQTASSDRPPRPDSGIAA